MMSMVRALSTPRHWLAVCGFFCLPMLAPANAATSDRIEFNSLSGAYLAARTADAGKDIGSAAAFYQAAHEADRDNLRLLERVVILTAANGDFDKALEFAERLIEEVPASRVARLLRAVFAIRGKTYVSAISEVEKSGNGVLAKLTNALITAWAQYGQGDAARALATIDALDGEAWYVHSSLLVGYSNDRCQ